MLSDLLANLNDLFIQYGYWGLFIACMGIVPAEPIMGILGAMKPGEVVYIALVSALGEMIGAYFTYAVGMLFKESKLIENIRKNGLYLNITEDGYLKSKKEVTKKGSLYLIISRFIPWLRIVSAVAAGFLRFNFLKFSIAVFVGTFGYAIIFALIGAQFEGDWSTVFTIVDRFNDIFLLVIIGFVVYKIWDVYRKARKSLK